VSESEYVWLDLPTAQSAGRRRRPHLTLPEELWVAAAGHEPTDRGVLCATFTCNGIDMTAFAFDVDSTLSTAHIPDDVVTLVLALLGTRPATGAIRGRRYVVVAVPSTSDGVDLIGGQAA
jgi:hypothetical protein